MRNLPNILTLCRILAVPALCVCFWIEGALGDWLALGIFTCAAATDFFDGWVARKFDAQSGFGRMLDPIADKLMVATSLILLVAHDVVAGLHLIAAIIILCREILVSGLREFLMETQIRLPVSTLAKYKTAIQVIAIAALLGRDAGEALLSGMHLIGLSLLWLAAGLTLITGYDYVHQGMRHAKWKN